MAYMGGVVRKAKPMFQRVLDCFDSHSEFARQMGVSRGLVYQWVRAGTIPAFHALEASLVAGGVVSAQELITEAHREKMRRRGVREGVKAARELASMEALAAAESGS